MVKRNADGTLKVIAQLPEQGFLRNGTPEERSEAQRLQEEKKQPITEAEVEAIRKQLAE